MDPKADLIEVDPKVVEVDPKVAETLPARRDGDKAMIVPWQNLTVEWWSFFWKRCTRKKIGNRSVLSDFRDLVS